MMEIALAIHITTGFVAARSWNRDACGFELRKRKQAAALSDGRQVPAVGEMEQYRDSAERIDRYSVIVRTLSYRPLSTCLTPTA
jgi:hypothetical protein